MCFKASGAGLAHPFSEWIARFLRKDEWISDPLKKTSDSLICSFLVSDLSDLLMVSHFWWVTWANCSWLLIFGERPERFAHITHFWWATWAIRSHRSLKKREWAIHSVFFYIQKTYQKIWFFHFSQIFLSESLIRWFIMSDLSD